MLAGLTQAIPSRTIQLSSSSDVRCTNSFRLGCPWTGASDCVVSEASRQETASTTTCEGDYIQPGPALYHSTVIIFKDTTVTTILKMQYIDLKISWRNSELLEWKLTQETGYEIFCWYGMEVNYSVGRLTMKFCVVMEWRLTTSVAREAKWPRKFWPWNCETMKWVLTIKKWDLTMKMSVWPWNLTAFVHENLLTILSALECHRRTVT